MTDSQATAEPIVVRKHVEYELVSKELLKDHLLDNFIHKSCFNSVRFNDGHRDLLGKFHCYDNKEIISDKADWQYYKENDPPEA